MEDKKVIIYIVIFVGYFLYSLVKDSKQEKKNKAAKKNRVNLPPQKSEEVLPISHSSSSEDSSITDLLERLKREAEQTQAVMPQPKETVVVPVEVPHVQHDTAHQHPEMSHHHKEAKPAYSPKKPKNHTENSSPFLSVEDALFTDKIQAVTLEGFEQTNEKATRNDVDKEYPLRSVEDAKRAFVYAEIWNRKYC